MSDRGPVKEFRRVRGLDAKSKAALWLIVAGVLFQCVILFGLVLGWWK